MRAAEGRGRPLPANERLNLIGVLLTFALSGGWIAAISFALTAQP